jgi:peroxidase
VGFKETSAHLIVSGGYWDSSTQHFAQRDGATPKLIITPYNVNATPRLIISPYNMDAPKSSTIEMPCKADGNPKPNITWTKDGAVLSLTKRHR